MSIQFSSLASRAETIIQARPDPTTVARPEGPDLPASRPIEPTTRTVTARGINEGAAVETRGEFTRGERADRRTTGQALQAATARAGLAQAAAETLRRGRDDLATLDTLARDRATRADVQRATLGREQRPVLEPERAEVDTPEAARDTRAAVADADARSRRLEEQVRAVEGRAADEARALTRDLAERAGSPRLDSARDAERTARQLARSTLDAPARALSTQPYLAVEAALRVLA